MAGYMATVEAAKINADAMRDVANTNAGASTYGSDQSSNASRFGSQVDLQGRQLAAEASKSVAQTGANASMYDADQRRSASTYSTDQGLIGQKYAADRGAGMLGGIGANYMNSLNNTKPPGYSQGTPKVPGHGDGTVDTVDAKLAPGEAVLNKAAAEMLGRGLIDLLNKHGMLKMGMPDPHEESEPEGYARGTSRVGC